ncbi:PQQ-binding-like beta-propeller repeat protein [Nocardia asteroides]|uniref:outer membrane protein assembly factor BamB family protein n=1 Tax=Nocardia asteroides TaxID=1824 RepID=UPI001E463682|nr:PQQ-binding-like beta-propeller repeat protein [Nocardia asteroides]UGT57122.1 PQQ-like beta-propeller repeat protein [Nocardia asteroides]
MDDSRTTLPRLRDYSRPLTAAAILGVVLLTGSIVLGLHSLIFAAGHPLETEPRGAGDIAHELGVFATALAVAALLALACALRWSRSLQAAGFGNVPTVAMHLIVVAEFVISIKLDIRDTVMRTLEHYSRFPQLPIAVAAWILTVVGTVLVLGASFAPPVRGALSRRSGATMAMIGVLVCAVATGVAVRAGDDSRFFDHRTAPPAAAAPLPTRLGTEQFRLDLPSSAAVVAGGPGFLVGTATGITAYDGVTGTPRWHHLRPGAHKKGVHLDISSLAVIEPENVVIAYWNSLGWTAYDAATGESLWTATDFSRDRTTDLSAVESAAPLPILARRDGAALIRYDARTGRRMWSAPRVPVDCAKQQSTTAITSTAVYQVMPCGTGSTATTTILALDALTGTPIAQRDLPAPESRQVPEVSVVDDVVSVDWDRRAGPLRHVHFASPDDLRTAEVTEPASVLSADPAAVLSTRGKRTTLTERADPAVSRPLPVIIGHAEYSLPNRETLLLAEEVVSIDDGLRTWHRGDLAENTPPNGFARCDPAQLLPAPGIVLILCDAATTAETQQIIGAALR